MRKCDRMPAFQHSSRDSIKTKTSPGVGSLTDSVLAVWGDNGLCQRKKETERQESLWTPS